MFLQSISVFIYILKIMAFCEFIISSCKQAKESCPSVFFFFFFGTEPLVTSTERDG